MDQRPIRRDTVLVVDDEADSLRLLTDTLEAGGITVLVATSGAAALDLLGHVVPCLLYTSPSPRDQRGSRMPSSA